MICDSCPPADSGAFGLATRWMLSQASLAVTVFPLWKVTPGRILIVQVFASLEGSTDSARAGSSWKSLFQNSSGSYRLHTRAMSAACTGWCGSRVSLLPPPVAPWIRVPPDFCAPPSPPPPLPMSPPSSPPPHAARKLLPATAVTPIPEYLSSWRRESCHSLLRGRFTVRLLRCAVRETAGSRNIG